MITEDYYRELLYEIRGIRQNTEYLKYLTFLEHIDADLSSISSELAGVIEDLNAIIYIMKEGGIATYPEFSDYFLDQISRIREHLWYISKRLYEIRNKIGGGL